jgi:hypothetical protein
LSASLRNVRTVQKVVCKNFKNVHKTNYLPGLKVVRNIKKSFVRLKECEVSKMLVSLKKQKVIIPGSTSSRVIIPRS